MLEALFILAAVFIAYIIVRIGTLVLMKLDENRMNKWRDNALNNPKNSMHSLVAGTERLNVAYDYAIMRRDFSVANLNELANLDKKHHHQLVLIGQNLKYGI